MKRRFLIVVLAIIAAFASMFGLVACGQTMPSNTEQGGLEEGGGTEQGGDENNEPNVLSVEDVKGRGMYLEVLAKRVEASNG